MAKKQQKKTESAATLQRRLAKAKRTIEELNGTIAGMNSDLDSRQKMMEQMAALISNKNRTIDIYRAMLKRTSRQYKMAESERCAKELLIQQIACALDTDDDPTDTIRAILADGKYVEPPGATIKIMAKVAGTDEDKKKWREWDIACPGGSVGAGDSVGARKQTEASDG